MFANSYCNSVVQLQSINCRSPMRCQANDEDTAFLPSKVIVPVVVTRIEQLDRLSAVRIYRAVLRALVTVAKSTRYAEVFFIVGTTCSSRDNVVYLEDVKDVILMSQAVFASVTCAKNHALAYIL